MAAEKDIREELFKQDDAAAQKMQELRNKILARDEARVSRLKKVTIVIWSIVVLGLVAALVIRPLLPNGGRPTSESASFTYQYLSSVFIVLMWGLTTIGAVLLVSLYIRSRTLTMHQLQASLAGIEEQLRKMAGKKAE